MTTSTGSVLVVAAVAPVNFTVIAVPVITTASVSVVANVLVTILVIVFVLTKRP
jgi:hypothetical protein